MDGQLESIGDAMLGSYNLKQDNEEKDARKRGPYELRGGRERKSHHHRGTSASNVHTTRERPQDRSQKTDGIGYSESQGAEENPNALRKTLKPLNMSDVNALDEDAAVKKIQNLLLDVFESEDWLLLGGEEVRKFREATEVSIRTLFRSLAIRVMTSDIMRNRNKLAKGE